MVYMNSTQTTGFGNLKFTAMGEELLHGIELDAAWYALSTCERRKRLATALKAKRT
jgi:hypothetical protein